MTENSNETDTQSDLGAENPPAGGSPTNEIQNVEGDVVNEAPAPAGDSDGSDSSED